MEVVLDWISGISWTLVYITAICIGINKKTYCVPGISICLNISWELWVVLIRVKQRSSLDSGFVSQLLWLILDFGVLYTWIRYAKESDWKKVLLLFGAAVAMAVIELGVGLWAEAAFAINLIMSVTFLFRLDKKTFVSLPIAVLKCLGTLPATILNGVLYKDGFVLAIGGLCLIADVYYIYDIWKQKTAIKK